MFKFLGGPIWIESIWISNLHSQFGEPIWTANLESQFWRANLDSQFGPGPKLTSKDENFSIQLWINVHNFCNSLHCSGVSLLKRSDC